MLNHITIMGRLTRDPDLRKTDSGISVASFTLAVDRDRKNDTGTRDTDFIDCVAWRGTADFVADYFTKGKLAAVSGRLQIREWTDKNDNKRKTAEVVADNVYFAESKQKESASKAEFTAPAVEQTFAPVAEVESDSDFPWL